MQSVNIMEWATKKSSHPNKATRAAASKTQKDIQAAPDRGLCSGDQERKGRAEQEW